MILLMGRRADRRRMARQTAFTGNPREDGASAKRRVGSPHSPETRATAALRSSATKQWARPHRCHRQVARGQLSVIVEHTDDDRSDDRQDDKQHHYADHKRPPSSHRLHDGSGQRGTSWARRLLRGRHSRGAPTKLVNAVADEHGMVGRRAAGVRARCLHQGDEEAVSVAPDDQAVAVVCNMNGSASAPSSVAMNGTLWAG
jgi:hypothetical protein